MTDWYADGHGIEGCLDIQHPVTQSWSEVECKYNGTGAGNHVSPSGNLIKP